MQIAATALYKVGPVSGKGLGVTASSPLRRGQQVMREAPLIDSPARLVLASPSQQAANDYFKEKVQALPQAQQDVFYSLSDWRNEQAGLPKTAYHVFRSNALPKGHGQQANGAAVYQTICRINHSCTPNCHYSWDPQEENEVVHSLADIPVGEELAVTYIELFATGAERRRILQDKFGFVCSCPACSVTGNDLRESDERRSLLAALDGQIRDCAVGSPAKAMAGLEEFFQLFAAEGIADTYLTARVCRIAVDICQRHPTLGSTNHFAELGLAAFTTSEGAAGQGSLEMRQWL